MEWWATVILVIGSNIVIGAVSIFTTRMQIDHSHKQWFRELRSEPLIKLKNELATVAAKYDNVLAAYSQLVNGSIPVEQAGKSLVQNSEDFLNYARISEWKQTLFLIYDSDIKTEVDKVLEDYRKSTDTLLSTKQIDSSNKTVWQEALKVAGRNNTRIEQIQSMLDKKLGEL